MIRAYYNEIEPYAAEWLRNLIDAGEIAPGDVDQRSIADVNPSDLAGYTQCHFFAGIGGWSLALRNAGCPDDISVWTGSCPCQPFSSAGAGRGADDPRHLWPQFYRLIRECEPATVIGEQVARKAGFGWLDGVFADLEGAGYACGAADLSAGGVGAPHIRQRICWVGNRSGKGLQGRGGSIGQHGPQGREEQRRHNPSPGVWGDYEVLSYKDGKRRRSQPCSHPLGHGLPKGVGQSIARGEKLAKMAKASIRNARRNRNGRLKGYGNAIVPEVASEFISAFMEVRHFQCVANRNYMDPTP